MEMEKARIYMTQGAASALTALITAKMGVLFYALIIFIAVMVIDFISGMMASKKEAIEHPGDGNYGWSSRKGTLGILKKFGYILVVAVAVIVDFLIEKVAGSMGIDMPASTFFGLLITVWFILNECLSIVENAVRLGVEGIPPFLTDAIAALKHNIDEKGGDNNGKK